MKVRHHPGVQLIALPDVMSILIQLVRRANQGVNHSYHFGPTCAVESECCDAYYRPTVGSDKTNRRLKWSSVSLRLHSRLRKLPILKSATKFENDRNDGICMFYLTFHKPETVADPL